ncbi:MAG: hypothetical protein LYZ66_03190 [Nitrososphaerales archaeon]|nr:hypothetical protein [Nitrososphaerales archaeon]
MNRRVFVEVVAANFILLLLLYWVSVDQAARAAYAAREGLAFIFTRSILTQSSTLYGSSGPLSSPLTLDWEQLLLLALVAFDLLFAYGEIAGRRSARVVSP